MQQQFVRVDHMQHALVQGRLTRVRSEAQALVDSPLPKGLPEAWLPYFHSLQKAAQGVVVAKEVSGMATAVAKVGGTCGHCHETWQHRLNLGWPPAPPETVDPRGHMQRHQWALDRFWDSLISAEDRGWQAGVKALEEPPLEAEDLTGKLDTQAEACIMKVHGLGEYAAYAETDDYRERLYARLVTVCANCHHQLNVRFPEN